MAWSAHELPIGELFSAYQEVLAGEFNGRPPGLAEENLQARIRGNLLMALSNKFGWLVLTTGNKSEMSVGYSTLYGDSAGGFAVIKDIEKTLVYELARWRNEDGGPIPDSILERAPSAELRPDQRDDQSLPPYDILDAILRGYVEEDRGREELIAARAARGGRREGDRARRPLRVQAPPGPAGHQGHRARVRPRPADADHQPLLRLSRAAGRTATVTREVAHRRPSSSEQSTSQTQSCGRGGGASRARGSCPR